MVEPSKPKRSGVVVMSLLLDLLVCTGSFRKQVTVLISERSRGTLQNNPCG